MERVSDSRGTAKQATLSMMPDFRWGVLRLDYTLSDAQETVRGFVHEDREARMYRPHCEECRDPDRDVVRPRHEHEDPNRDGVQHGRVHHVVEGRNAAELFA